jgi:fatty acid desaturase
MATVAPAEPAAPSLRDPELKAKLQELRRTDNVTNWWYIARTWLFLAAVIGGVVAFDVWRSSAGLLWLWSVPVYAVAVVLVGAGQHQLSGLAHEASHHILFRNRVLNETVSDLLCMFPLFAGTHMYRLQHLAHHQFVNDPDRDPDQSQLRGSGHWLAFPLARADFLRALVRFLWPFSLIRFMRVRAQYNSTGTNHNPYLRRGEKPSRVAIRLGIAYMLLLVVSLTAAGWAGSPFWLAAAPLGLWAAFATVFALLPDRCYQRSRVHAAYSRRVMTLQRISFYAVLFSALAWTTYLTGRWAAVDFALLWVLPIFTSFSLFMILRQLVQHGNGGRGWLTNTRVFLLNRAIRYAVFPMGQDYHLPHHMYSSIPHYRLRQLHEFLMGYPEYRQEAVVVHGYFRAPAHAPQGPTVLDVVGPAYAPGEQAVFIDDEVLEGVEVDERDQIERERQASVAGERADG